MKTELIFCPFRARTVCIMNYSSPCLSANLQKIHRLENVSIIFLLIDSSWDLLRCDAV